MSLVRSLVIRILKLKAFQWALSLLIRKWPWSLSTWLCVLAFAWYKLVPLFDRHILGLPPGPRVWPILGNAFQMLGSSPHKRFLLLGKEHGPIVFLRMGLRPCLVLSSADMAEQVLQTQGLKLESRPTSWMFHGFLHISEDRWRLLHLVSCEFFSNASLQATARIRREERVSLVNSISQQETKVSDLGQELQWYVLKLLCRLLFSKKLESRQEDFAKQVSSICHKNRNSSVQDLVPFIWMLLKSPQGTASSVDRVLKMIVSFLGERTPAQMDLAHLLEQQQDGLPRDEQAALLLNALLVGQQYTVSLLNYAMAELVRHPKCMSRLREDLNSVVGKNRPVEEGDIPNLSYLQCIVKETLRLHPPAPLGLPRCNTAPLFISGYRIPAGCTSFVNSYAIARDPSTWAAPDEFKPERFEYSSVDVLGKHLDLIPFSSGARMCPAAPLVVLETTMVLATLIHAFDWEAPPPPGVVRHVQKLLKLDPGSSSSIAMDESVAGPFYVCSRKSSLEFSATPRTLNSYYNA